MANAKIRKGGSKMKKGNVLSCLSLSVILILMAAVPKVLNYQGKLLDTSGVGVNDTLDMTFRLYTSQTGGTAIWIEDHNGTNAVPVSNGLFSVELGSIIPFPPTVDFSIPYWLEIQVGTEILSPRERLTSAPYALQADRVTRAIQSISSVIDTTQRTGRFVFRADEGATLSDDGSTINITLGSTGIPTLHEVLIEGNDAGGRQIKNLAEPTETSDAATKNYVDLTSAAAGGVNTVSGGAGLVPDGPSVGNVALDVNVDNSTVEISGDMLRVKPGGITSNEILDGTITTSDIGDGQVTAVDIATDAVESAEIASGAVGYNEIADNAVGTDHIIDGAVTMAKLADFSTTGATVGDVFYFDGSQWVNLAPSDDGDVLTTHGPGNPPTWETPAALEVFNFILSANPSSDGLSPGEESSTTIDATGVAGDPQEITFYASALPTGASASFSPPSCTPTGSPPTCNTTMTITTSPTISVGTYPVTITGVVPAGMSASATYSLSVATAPAQITDLTATTDGYDQISLSWSPPPDGGSPITAYNIYRGTSPGGEVFIATSSLPNYTDTGLTPCETYYYKVSAINAVGEGELSNEASASPCYASCKAILDAGESTGNGVYTIDPDGLGGVAPFDVYCDMTTDGGGWTLIMSVHEDDLAAKCDAGDLWTSTTGNSSSNPGGTGNWQNTNTFGTVTNATSADYKNPAYWLLTASNVMVYQVPNDVTVNNWYADALFRYYTTSGFLGDYGGNLYYLYHDHYPVGYGGNCHDTGPAIPITWDKGSNSYMDSLIPPNAVDETTPGYIHFRVFNNEHGCNALCSGIRYDGCNTEHACMGGGGWFPEGDPRQCSDYSAWDWDGYGTHSGWSASLTLTESAMLLFYR